MQRPKIRLISIEDAADIVENAKNSNHQMFVTKLQRDTDKPWLAIDNTSGTAVTKFFATREEAEQWLSEEISF